MGVRGLQGFVGSTCPHICTVVNFKELAEHHRSKYPGCTPTIVVDAMCCLRYWYTPESWICGGQWREYFSALRDFVKTFTAAGIKLIFFFDGMVEQDKRDEWVKRRLKNNREISRIFHYIKSHKEQPGRNMFFIPSGLAVFTRFALKTLGQETLCSLQEADYEVASYGLQHNCLGILGEDTDYLIYDTCPYFSISELCLESLDTVMLCREKLCESLGLCVADLPLLACLLGNDIIPEGMFESFRYKCLSSYTSVKENFDKKGNIILAVSDHISKVLYLYQGEKKLEEILPLGPNKALFYKGMASYLLPGQKSPWFFQKPKGVITLDKQVISTSSDAESREEVPMCSDAESRQEVPMCTGPESRREVPVYTDSEPRQEVPMCSDPEPRQEVPTCTGPESRREVPMCSDPEPRQEVPMCTGPEARQEVPMYTDSEPRQEVPMYTDSEPRQEVPMYTGSEPRQEVPMYTGPESRQEVPMYTGPESRQEVLIRTDPESRQEIMCTGHESKQEVPICTDPISKQEDSMCTHAEINQKLPVATDFEFKLEALMCTNPEIKQEDPTNVGPEVKQQVTMVSDTEILKVARTHHVQAESYLVYNIMSSGEIECSNTLEDELDQALPSQAFIYRPIRQRVYSLLLEDCQDVTSTCLAVKEWFVYPGNPLRHPDLVRPLQMTIPGGTPSLKILWLNQEPEIQVRRLDTLLACFNLSSSREELQAVESPFQALCCLLIYLFVQVDTLCLEDLHAFIAQALCLQGKSTSQLVNLQPDYINPRAVQLGSLLVRGLTTLVLVNSACGFPWKTSDFMPWNVFDGKLFHQKYLQSEKGYAVEVLLEQNRSRLTKFHNLKAVVCKACMKENRRITGRAHWGSHHAGRWGRQGSSYHRTGSGYSRSSQGQPWRDQGPGSRQYEHDQWRRY
ncbi:family with sequence similarity 120B [Homo sapiens]|uniref:Constitutive coactivator of peroxisome proliferator-activated receptor gamma n=4 Tax=Homo sapiens TaxID=9606 RepID=F120B_HUMAN|nr:constitutive coactivator of peroxisome proliferator-activated receptor gamma isoform c [Homo sapiens]Q96EK7.1 RecName: Full=Constitutive coactivator of peroxisome proliferator-activated receptor gamma; Short=Constitutive coactivator of PPAR-gamma; Short=Constitutive coactivator of PPARG; AltName: Full=PPARG constitutive coactivator 1; Short=PGCC1; AltName: Full=Protein FAM120B [Homo sapiens]AAH12177.1 Family with sequence similarity 120B [Homo sapiens]ABH09086.1 PPARgamma constitutive coactiv|eukprot:NP_115824.1 constitutive coactivator of peroxisome proliferator-activated receptor gamma isoform c [Homo sapiens]